MSIHFSGRFEVGDKHITRRGVDAKNKIEAEVTDSGLAGRIAEELPPNAILELGPTNVYTETDPTKRRNQSHPDDLFLLVEGDDGQKRLAGTPAQSILHAGLKQPGLKGAAQETLADLVARGLETFKTLI